MLHPSSYTDHSGSMAAIALSRNANEHVIEEPLVLDASADTKRLDGTASSQHRLAKVAKLSNSAEMSSGNPQNNEKAKENAKPSGQKQGNSSGQPSNNSNSSSDSNGAAKKAKVLENDLKFFGISNEFSAGQHSPKK
ncbi:MAG: hypothetical protein Q9207_002619 [Kuettlingeria erythrocarpa]